MTTKMSEIHGDPLPENAATFLDRFSHSVTSYTNNIALVCIHQPPTLFGIPSEPLDDAEYHQSPYLRWTYKDLRRGIDRLISGLQAQGVRPGMSLVTFLQNSAEYVLTLWAANELGCVLAPINPRNLANTEEVSHMLKTVLIAAPGQELVFIAGNLDLAQQIDSLPDIKDAIKIVVSDNGSKNGWIRFGDIMDPGNPAAMSNEFSREPSLVLFTSGTTSLPKGCEWTLSTASANVNMKLGRPGSVQAGDSACIVVPNNHALGWLCLTSALGIGATAVFPGPTFDPQAMMAALLLEKCTHTALVPTMMHAILGVEKNRGQRLSLKNVMLGGSLVSPKSLRQVVEDLGSVAVECQYGMTEGVLICTDGQSDPAKIINGDDVSVGWIGRASSIKICAPDNKTPLARGIPGEIHISGSSICKGYIGQKSDEFYQDSGERAWFITGDQGVIDEQDRIYVVGRYKEMIIRGGENIAPAAIESVLVKSPGLAALNVQAVGAPDSIAGEVLVIVVQGIVDANTVREVRDAIVERMGTAYLPDEVISLETLGLQDFPRTMAGKVQKTKIAKLVENYRKEHHNGIANYPNSQLKEDVVQIWAKAVGLEPHQLSLDAPISDFADSITVMRVRDKIMRQTGRTLSLAEMAEAGTLGAQIKLLEAQPTNPPRVERKALPQRPGPPSLVDMAHLIEDPELFHATKGAVEKVVTPFGLGWDDVAEVIPVYDYSSVLIKTEFLDTLNWKMAVLPENIDEQQLRRALEMTLRNNPMLASFFVWIKDASNTDVPLHATMKNEKKLLDQVIQYGGTLKTLDELKVLTLKYPHPKHATFPGPMFRTLIYYVEETNSCGLLFNVNHAVIDASYMQVWFEDFGQALSPGTTQLHQHIDYKIWADSYFSLRTSSDARATTKWHVKRLKDLDKHRRAIFPKPFKRATWDPALELDDEDGVQHSFEAPDIVNLRKQHRTITAPVVVKTALTLLNIHETGHTHALFSNLEAARTIFPFIPRSMLSLGQFEATDVAGPTWQAVINLIEIKPNEPVVDFLYRMQDDQTDLTKHASAPWREIMAALGKAGEMIPAITQAQIFNWVPGMGTTGTDPYENFKVLSAVVRPAVGVTVFAGIGGADLSTIFMHLRGDAVTQDQIGKMARDLEKIVLWIVDEKNWERGVGGFGECLLR